MVDTKYLTGSGLTGLRKRAFTPLTPEAQQAAAAPPMGPPQGASASAPQAPPQAPAPQAPPAAPQQPPPPQGGDPQMDQMMQIVMSPEFQQFAQQNGVAVDPQNGPVNMQTGQPVSPEEFTGLLQAFMQQGTQGVPAPAPQAPQQPPPGPDPLEVFVTVMDSLSRRLDSIDLTVKKIHEALADVLLPKVNSAQTGSPEAPDAAPEDIQAAVNPGRKATVLDLLRRK